MYFRTSFTWEAENTPYLEVQNGGLEERTREKRVSVEVLIERGELKYRSGEII